MEEWKFSERFLNGLCLNAFVPFALTTADYIYGVNDILVRLPSKAGGREKIVEILNKVINIYYPNGYPVPGDSRQSFLKILNESGVENLRRIYFIFIADSEKILNPE